MSIRRKLRLSGKVSLAYMSSVAIVLLAGSLLASRRSAAQGTANPPAPVYFAPTFLSALDGIYGDTTFFVSSVLPAVPHATTPFRIQVVSSEGPAVTLDIPRGPEEFDTAEVQIVESALYIFDLNSRTFAFVNLPNDEGEIVSVRILPAIRSNGQPAYPFSADIQISSLDQTSSGDAITARRELLPANLPAVQ